MHHRHVHVCPFSSDLGFHIPGSRLGPEALLTGALLKELQNLGHSVTLSPDHGAALERTEVPSGTDKMKHGGILLPALKQLAHTVQNSLNRGETPITLGGDHSLSIGSLSGVSAWAQSHGSGRPIGVLWFDAHADMNTPDTSPSGNLHGMPLAALLGEGHASFTRLLHEKPKLNPKSVSLIGVRSMDPEEALLCHQIGVHLYTAEDVQRRGIISVTEEALEFALKDSCGVHVSFDLDCLDPEAAPATDTPEPGGLTLREALCSLKLTAQTGRLVSADLVEFNPLKDGALRTRQVAFSLLKALLS